MFITLTTDMGLKDYYVATLKGAIYSELPDAKIIDISHNIPPFDITNAAFVIKNSFKHFPKNTIHVIGIDAEPSDLTRHIIVETQDQYFIGADNGIFSLIFDKQPDGVWEINLKTDGDEYSFPTKNIFIKAACHLARGGLPAVIGKPLDKIKPITNELKVIINNKHDLTWANKQTHGLAKNCKLYLQPEWSKKEQMMPLIIDFVKKNGRWTISLQTHKYMNIP